ncbi:MULTISPECIES: YceK/YidQ family lipoprotein [Kosakonia]|jgi:uncharacterized protein YceK|uniref:YceK/YidQ family lipoprotein n=1 Tax=Kosakonia cowanii JCM 10956 = DSM 18146 TaxID=1300165 RepID=A0A807LEG2_9ENTR|nr:MULTISPECIES: YceK/YidQ family lipoprotein [Kosakonia]MDP9769039.1 uncharacterized protein YceK [Atlantibacter hermannii]MDT3410033.1 uncharacterized protein YceK [Atlantibacter sp. SORGH_AS_0304]APZ05006.1 hypothetical protein BWI95_08025 [Kosakonia cowanii JCM 10956 = DSM 18146]AST71414.1 YceK/YidQ family lipoprotein [Kosakonia cowanii]MBK0016993.1 YceK/YidQ family lipoprotein [Kosakonia sp. S42]
MMKTRLIVSALVCGVMVSGCSSVMSHTGGKEGLYPGTKASSSMISDDDTGIGMKSLVALDMPFTALLDTLLIPWDLFRRDNSVKARVEKSERENEAINSLIPPAPMPVH